MTNEYYISHDEGSMSIGLKPLSHTIEDYLGAFINIHVDDTTAGIDSIFKNIEDAEIFAEAIVKLLKTIPLGEEEK